MHWRDAGSERAPRDALALSVDERRPGMVVEASRSRRLCVLANERVHLWARVERSHAGVWVLRARTSEPLAVVDPIRASEARSMTAMGDWMRWFARALDRSERSPLRAGAWELTHLERIAPTLRQRSNGIDPDIFRPKGNDHLPSHAYQCMAALELPRVHYVDWGINGSGDVIPLRDFSAADSARVKAWRKHARERTLPPILVWWVTALDAYVIVDGHDRLKAAAEEGVSPALIALWQPHQRPMPENERATAQFLERYAKAFANEAELSDETRQKLNAHLVAFHENTWRSVMTTSRANPKMDEAWIEGVTREAEDDTDRARMMSDD